MAPPRKWTEGEEEMEIDADNSVKEKEKEPTRISGVEIRRREYWLRARASKALSKLDAKRYHYGYHKWENMSKSRRRQEELFFSFDVDFNRINLSDAPPAHKKAQIMQPAPGDATSLGIKLSHTSSQWDLVSNKQMLQPAPAGGATSPVPSIPNNY